MISGDDLLKEYISLLDDAIDYTECGYRRPRAEVVVTRKAVDSRADTSVKPDKPPGEELPAEDSLERIASEIAVCRKCRLHETRTNTVPGEGVEGPLVMCIGEGPGAEEDKTGKPFVGRAGQYLDKWLEAVELSRTENCFIGNVVKCRPPGNRDPLPEEIESCLPYLKRQLKIIRPKMILTLGRIATQILVNTQQGIGAMRGGTYEFMKIPVIPTYHPSGVLRNQEYRKPVWDDLRRLKSLLENG